jgi:hypothetical protein
MSGLVGPPAYANVQTPYYLTKSDKLTNDLISPVSVLSADLSKTATISVDNEDGFIALSTGSNPNTGGPPRLGLILNSGADGVVAIVGDSTIASTPTLELRGQIDAVPTTSQVYDEVFNPPVAGQVVNILGPDPTANYPNGWITDSPNDGTIFTSGGSAPFDIPKTGYYIIQSSIMMAPATVSAGGSAGGAFSLQITVNNFATPFNPIGGIVIGQPTPLSSNEDQPSYYSWNSYIPLVEGQLYTLTVRMLAGGGVYLPPNPINNIKYSDLKIQLIKVA